MVSKQYMIAVMVILLGVGLTQYRPDSSFVVGLGMGTIVMSAMWIIILIVRDLKKK